MDKKWMPITAGVLDILYGAWYVFAVSFIIIKSLTSPWRDLYGVQTSEMVFCAIIISLGALAIISGAYAVKRKRWWLALVGVIVASIMPVGLMVDHWLCWFDPSDLSFLFTFKFGTGFPAFFGVPAIVAIILIILSRKQFAGKQVE
jgi:hypothetical protein